MEVAKYNPEAEVISEAGIIKQALTHSVKIRDAKDVEIAETVNKSVEAAILYLGLNTNREDRDAIKLMVFSDIKRHFLELTVSEIAAAIDNGVHGSYGDVRGLAPKDIYAWLLAYSQSDLRKQQMAEISKITEVKPEPTEEEKATLYWNNLVNAWLTFKKDGCYNDHGNSVYNILLANGKINYSDEQMADFMRIAKADLMKEYNPLQHVGNFVKVNEFKAIINEIVSGGDENTRVKVAAKKVALNSFFKELAEMDMEITDLFAE